VDLNHRPPVPEPDLGLPRRIREINKLQLVESFGFALFLWKLIERGGIQVL